MSAGEVVHPVWCSPGECVTTATSWGLVETSHQSEVFELALSRPREVGPPGPRTAGVDLAANWRRPARAVVLAMAFDDIAPDGAQVGADPVVVLDTTDRVTTLTPMEAARVGAALLRAARVLVSTDEQGGEGR